MRIVSKFKDYYDFISHKFGQDPDIVYERKPVGKPGAVRVQVEWPVRGFFDDTLAYYKYVHRKSVPVLENEHCKIMFVVAGSRCVPFIVNAPYFSTYVDTRLSESWERLTDENAHRLARTWQSGGRQGGPLWPSVPTDDKLRSLVRAVGAPVFVVEGKWSKYAGRQHTEGVWVRAQVPVLAELGFPSLVPAQEMWQDLYEVMTNVLRENPDKAPPVQVEEKYRIEGAGFDLKTSFRHPVNKPSKKKK